MPTALLLRTPDARRTANRLLGVLQRERIADGAAATDSSVPGPGGSKGALMLLMRWLEAQLRDSDPGPAQLRTAPVRREPAHETPCSG